MAVKLVESDVDARQPSGTLTLKTFATLVLMPEYASFGAAGWGSSLVGVMVAGVEASLLGSRRPATIAPATPKQKTVSVMMTIRLRFASIYLLYRYVTLLVLYT